MEEKVCLTEIKGEYIDTIIRHNEDGEVVETVELPLKTNVITIGISTLMAGLIQGAYASLPFYWAVGTGTQGASTSVTNLVAEYSRKQVAIQFVDQTNSVVTTPTSRIVMSASWAQGELGVVSLTEFAIFGGTNANVANGGLAMDYSAHAGIALDSTTSLTRKIYFQF